MKRAVSVLLSAILLLSVSSALSETFIRIDRDDPDAWRGELANVRFLTEERMSGSAQFSEAQFSELAAQLKEQAGHVYVVDCRQESHGFINGIAVSWCGENNAANHGMTAEEIEAAEEELGAVTGKTVTAFTSENDLPVSGMDMLAETWNTERALVEAAGFSYLRLACPDHCWPPSGVIDAFIGFAKDLPGDAWLHFHCQAGSGRTGAFMTVYEMMQKPDTPVEDILGHQADTGSGNLLERAKPEKSYDQKIRCVMARAIYLYIHENRKSGYALSWTDWLEAHSRFLTLQAGESFTEARQGFSSDPAVADDSLRAVGEGEAAVLVGDDVFFVTVRRQ